MACFIECDFTLIKEHPLYPGFFYPPFKTTPEIVVNNEGIVIDPIRGVKRKINDTPKGYLTTFLKVNDKNFNFALHRLVAFIFKNRPERHLDKDFCELQVNHEDGNKHNNKSSNLEWVDGYENMDHARENGLFSNDKPVLVKNVETGVITKYRSVSYCARYFLISSYDLRMHLHSSSVGRIIVDDHVFKNDDNTVWPDLILSLEGKEYMGRNSDIVAENKETNSIVLIDNLKAACILLGLNLNVVKNNRTRKGVDFPTDGWIFYPLSEYIDNQEK